MARAHAGSASVALTVVGILAGALTACASGDFDNAASDPRTSASPSPSANGSASTDPETASSVSTESADPDTGKYDNCQDQKPITGKAADTFGAEEVMDAYCTVVKLEMEQGFIDDYVRANKEDLTVKDFSVWNKYMVKATAAQWNANVEKALQGDEDAQSQVYTLMYFQAIPPDSGYEFTDEPSVLNQAFTPAITELDTVDGVDRLIVRFKVTGDFNFVKSGTTEPYYKIASTRDITFALIRNPDTSNEDTDWLIQSWTGTYKFGDMVESGPVATASITS